MKKIFAGFVAGYIALNFLNIASAADFHGQDLSSKVMTKQQLDGSDFTGAILKGANLSGSSLRNAIFKDADLSGLWMNDADCTGADMRGVLGSYLTSRTIFDKANMEGLALAPNNCSFKGANLKNTKFSGYVYNCDFSGADFSGSNLRLMAVNTDSNKWKGATYNDDTAWPDGFDPKAVGAVLIASTDSKTAPASTSSAPSTSTAGGSFASGLTASAPAQPATPIVNPFTAVKPANSIAGKYVGETNKQAWCTLNEDGSMVFHESGQDMKGTYTVSGDDVSLTISGQTIKTKISGNALLPPGGSGQKLIKEGGAGAAASDTTSTAPSVAGKYVSVAHPETSCLLKADGTLVFHEEGKDMAGTYKVDGDSITLSIEGESIKVKVSGNALLSPVGDDKMIKQ